MAVRACWYLAGTGNAILTNYITANGGLGIDLGATGVTANDVGDGDTGANNLLNFPMLTPTTGGVQLAFNGLSNTTFRIDFFGNTTCDASGNGEAEPSGSTTITTDAAGNIAPTLFPVAANWFVTATATDPSNNTSSSLGARSRACHPHSPTSTRRQDNRERR